MVIECLAISLQLVQSDIHDWPIRLLKMAIECLASSYLPVSANRYLAGQSTYDGVSYILRRKSDVVF